MNEWAELRAGLRMGIYERQTGVEGWFHWLEQLFALLCVALRCFVQLLIGWNELS